MGFSQKGDQRATSTLQSQNPGKVDQANHGSHNNKEMGSNQQIDKEAESFRYE